MIATFPIMTHRMIMVLGTLLWLTGTCSQSHRSNQMRPGWLYVSIGSDLHIQIYYKSVHSRKKTLKSIQ